MITTLLWDHDGVLVDTEHPYYQATREVMATVGATLTEALYRQHLLGEPRARGTWPRRAARGVPRHRGLAARAAGLRCWVVPSLLTAASSFEEAERRFSSLAELSAALTG